MIFTIFLVPEWESYQVGPAKLVASYHFGEDGSIIVPESQYK